MRDARLALPLICLLVVAGAATPPAHASSRSEARMVRAVNAFRAAHGVAPLRPSRHLRREAGSFSRWMLDADVFAHAERRASLAPGQTQGCYGEVLARHTGGHPRVRRTLRMWDASAPHRDVLLDRRYRWIGAGRALGAFDGWRTTLWTVRVGCSRRG